MRLKPKKSQFYAIIRAKGRAHTHTHMYTPFDSQHAELDIKYRLCDNQLSTVTAVEQQLFSAIYENHKHLPCQTFHCDYATQLPLLPLLPQVPHMP